MKKVIVAIIIAVVVLFTLILVLAKVLPKSDTDVRSGKSLHANIVIPDGAPLLPFTIFSTGSDATIQDGKFDFSSSYSEELGIPTTMHIVYGPDQLAAVIKSEQPEIAVVPVNLAAKLYNDAKNGDSPKYQFATIASWGMNEIVCNYNVGALQDLVGTKLVSFGQAETPGIALRTLLKKQEVGFINSVESTDSESPSKSVSIIDVASASDVVAALTKGANSNICGLLPEPVATTFKQKTSGKFDIKLDLQKVWETAFGGENYPQAGIIIRSDFLDNEANSTYISTLLTLLGGGTINGGTVLVSADPKTAITLAVDTLKSTMFSNTEASIEAINSGRLKISYGPTTDQYQPPSKNGYQENRALLLDYLQTIFDFSSNSKALIGDSLPDDGFWANYAMVTTPSNNTP